MDFHTGQDFLNICGPQVSRLRTERAWSQPDLATKCQLAGWDVSRDIIARIEGRNRWVGDFELATLANVFGVGLEELFPPDIRRRLSTSKARRNKA